MAASIDNAPLPGEQLQAVRVQLDVGVQPSRQLSSEWVIVRQRGVRVHVAARRDERLGVDELEQYEHLSQLLHIQKATRDKR